MTSSEPIWAALFAAVAAMPGLVMSSRRLKDVTSLTAAQMPALYLHQDTEKAEKIVRGLPTIWRLHGHIYLYASNGDPNIAPSTVLNPLVGSLRSILMPGPPENEQTLGGLVQWCRIDEVLFHEGTDMEQMIALVPVQMLTT